MNKIVTILVATMLLLVSATYSQISLTLTPSVINGNTGDTVTARVAVSNFSDIVSMQFGIKWDPAVLQYNNVDSFNLKDLTAGSFNPDQTNGFLSLAWFESSTEGVSVNDDESIFIVKFVVLGNANSGTLISFASRPGLSIELIGTSGEVTNSVTFTDSQFGDPNGNGGGNNGNTDPLASSISSTSGQNGTTVCVNVNVSNFTDITQMQYSLNWNASVLQFNEIRNINLAGLAQNSFGTNNAANGQLDVNWTNVGGASTPNGTNIYQICFNLIGNGGTSSAVSFSSTPTPISVTTTASVTSVGITQSNGTISVTGSNVEPGGQDVIFNINPDTFAPGTSICVPITVKDFDNITGYQFTVIWDSAVLQYTGAQNFGISGATDSDLGITMTANGRLLAIFVDDSQQGVNLADGATLFEICFNVVGSNGTSTTIDFAPAPAVRELIDVNGEIAFSASGNILSVSNGDGGPIDPPVVGDAVFNFTPTSAAPGSSVCFPITVKDFNDITGYQFTVIWDPAVMQYTGAQNFGISGATDSDFGTTMTANGQLLAIFVDDSQQGVNLADGTVLFELCFNIVGANGTSTDLDFAPAPAVRELIDVNGELAFSANDATITVSDGGGPVDPPVVGDAVFSFTPTTAAAGSSVCFPITVKDFKDITGYQFTITWDSTVLEYTGAQNFGIPGASADDFGTTKTASGELLAIFVDQSQQGVNLADGIVLFELCFNVIGANGTSTTLGFAPAPAVRELIDVNGELTFSANDATITVSDGGGPVDPPLTDAVFNFTPTTVKPDTTICFPITLKDFDDITGYQFTITWDSTVLEYTGAQNFGISGASADDFGTTKTASGELLAIFVDQSQQGVNLADGSILFEVCFKVIGTNGTSTTLGFAPAPAIRELIDVNGEQTFTANDATITINGDGGPIDPPVADAVFNFTPKMVEPGTSVCFPITVKDFTNITGYQFTVTWNPSVLEYTGAQGFGISGASEDDFGTTRTAIGELLAIFVDQSQQGVNLTDGSILFEICFNVVGSDGTSTTLGFAPAPAIRELINLDGELMFTGNNATITVNEAGACPGSISAIPSNPTNVSCNGDNDGVINITVTGGDGTYAYQWSDSNIGNTPNPTGLTAGVYNVTITSCGGQEVVNNLPVALLTITEPPAIVTVVTPQDVNCFGDLNGIINVSISGGTAPYTYQWSDTTLAPLNRPVNTPAGAYSLTITDGNGCEESTQNIVIGSPTQIISAVATTPASCSGMADGTATLTTSGGSSPYTYDWGNSNISGANPSNVPAGTYTVTITDDNRCTVEVVVTVDASVMISGMVQVIEDACGDNKGAIQIAPSGGTSPYSYSWSGPASIGDVATAENIPTGTYSVVITDVNGCFSTIDTIEVGGPIAILSASGTVNDVDCPEDGDGSIAVTAAGGFSPYTYLWSNGATTSTINNLAPGAYTVTVSDSKACTYEETFAISSTSNLSINVTILQGAPNGSASATVTGGVMSYTYEWCNGEDTPTAINLDEGVCSITVIDALGCTIVEAITIEVDSPKVEILVSNPISCNGESNGILQAQVTDGKAPFTYLWSTGATSNILVNIGAGLYGVTVTDVGGNTGVTSFNFTEPDPIIIDANELKPSGMEGGKICITITGGTSPYKSIAWSNGENDVLCIENLLPGEYGVIVTDQNDCTQSANFRIVSDPAFITCFTSIKVMTPNGDARNDAFRINCVDMANNNHLEIYNRWGQLVFEADNYQCVLGTESDCWTGLNRNGRNVVDEGGYFWILEFDDTNGRTRIRDHVTIMREN